MAQAKLLVTEARGNVSHPRGFDKLVGYIVIEETNSTRFKIGELIPKIVLQELIDLNQFTVIIRGSKYVGGEEESKC